MAKGHTRRQEAQREGREDQRPARAGEKPDFIRVTSGNADYGTPVQRDMARLRGRSRSDLASDAERGAGSPLGGRRKR